MKQKWTTGRKNPIKTIALLGFLIFFSGCLGGTNERLDSIDENTRKLADELRHDRKYLEGFEAELRSINREMEGINEHFSEFYRLADGSVSEVGSFFNKLNDEFFEDSEDGASQDLEVDQGSSGDQSEPVEIDPDSDNSPITGEICSEASIEHLVQKVNDFENYHDLPGSTYKWMIFPMLDMIESNLLYENQSLDNHESVIEMVFEPLPISFIEIPENHFPRLTLRCDSNWRRRENGKRRWSQECRQIASEGELSQIDPSLAGDEPERFGIDFFWGIFSIQENDDVKCDGKTRLTYFVWIQGNELEINEIKQSAVSFIPDDKKGKLRDKVTDLFDSGTFFRQYFENLHRSWSKL